MCARLRERVQFVTCTEIILKLGTVFGLGGFIFMSLLSLPLFLNFFFFFFSAEMFLLEAWMRLYDGGQGR